MKYSILVLFLGLLSSELYSQYSPGLIDVHNIQPDQKFDNIHVLQVAGDYNSSTFVIWVKKEVPEHYHGRHSEQLYVLEGRATMTLNGEPLIINPGDWIWIPAYAVHSVKVHPGKSLKVVSIKSPEYKGDDRLKPPAY